MSACSPAGGDEAPPPLDPVLSAVQTQDTVALSTRRTPERIIGTTLTTFGHVVDAYSCQLKLGGVLASAPGRGRIVAQISRARKRLRHILVSVAFSRPAKHVGPRGLVELH